MAICRPSEDTALAYWSETPRLVEHPANQKASKATMTQITRMSGFAPVLGRSWLVREELFDTQKVWLAKSRQKTPRIALGVFTIAQPAQMTVILPSAIYAA